MKLQLSIWVRNNEMLLIEIESNVPNLCIPINYTRNDSFSLSCIHINTSHIILCTEIKFLMDWRIINSDGKIGLDLNPILIDSNVLFKLEPTNSFLESNELVIVDL